MARVIAICEYVQDGDTFRTVAQDWIRLANVCTPEKGTSGFLEAKSTLERIILNKSIVYEQVGTSYGRMVTEVWVDGMNVNAYMRGQGYTCP